MDYKDYTKERLEAIIHLADWAINRDTGSSSKLIARIALSILMHEECCLSFSDYDRSSYPGDNGDYIRCFTLLHEYMSVDLIKEVMLVLSGLSDGWKKASEDLSGRIY